jgi:CelD/BcsL family acetyltransferase involved in cellulose biosynthesis
VLRLGFKWTWTEPVHVTLMHPSELGTDEIDAWHAMQQATPSLANPFLSPEYAVAVGRFRPLARVAVLMEGPSIAGFFPFERRRLGVGVPIGGWLTPSQALIHAPGVEWDSQALLRECQLSAWQFDNLVAGQQPFERYQAASVPSPIIDLVDGFDSYYAKLRVKSPRFCKELARKIRKIEREAGELGIVIGSRDPGLLGKLIGWKSDQYRRTGCVDRFERPWVGGLLDYLLTAGNDHVSGFLSILCAGDRPVAAQFGLRTGGLLVGWFTAYDTGFRKYSPGMIHLMQMAEQLSVVGIRTVQMGKGARRYTQAVKSHDILVLEGIVTSRSMLGSAHRVRNAAGRCAGRIVRRYPSAHRIADHILRYGGIARRTYGRL